LEEPSDIEVAVISHRADLDLAISTWVSGYLAHRVDDPTEAVDVAARGGVVLIDLAHPARAEALNELRTLGFRAPAVVLIPAEFDQARDLDGNVVLPTGSSIGLLKEALDAAYAEDPRWLVAGPSLPPPGVPTRRDDAGSSSPMGAPASPNEPALQPPASGVTEGTAGRSVPAALASSAARTGVATSVSDVTPQTVADRLRTWWQRLKLRGSEATESGSADRPVDATEVDEDLSPSLPPPSPKFRSTEHDRPDADEARAESDRPVGAPAPANDGAKGERAASLPRGEEEEFGAAKGPLVAGERAARAWVLLDLVQEIIIDGGAMVTVLDSEGSLSPIAAIGIAPEEGAFSLPIGHPIVAAAMNTGPQRLSGDDPIVLNFPMAGCPAIDVIPAGVDPATNGLIIVGGARSLQPDDVGAILTLAGDRARLQARVGRLRPDTARTLSGPASAHGEAPAEASMSEASGNHIREGSPRPWHVLNAAPRNRGGPAAAGLGREGQINKQAAAAAWLLLSDVFPLLEGGGAIVAVKSTEGDLAPIAAVRCEPKDGARTIPIEHPLLQRLRDSDGIIAVDQRDPGGRASLRHLPLSHHRASLFVSLGPPGQLNGVLMIGRARRPSSEELGRLLGDLQAGRAPTAGTPGDNNEQATAEGSSDSGGELRTS
jgi:hypothetical protein